MTSEELFQIYHKECLLKKNGSPPRAVKDFTKFQSSDQKPYFDRFVQMKERSGDLLNVTLFCKALADHYNGFFPPKAFITQSAIKIYRIYLQEFNKLEDPQDILKRLYSDCLFVAKFCNDNRITDGVIGYFHHNEAFIPSAIKHAYSGNTSYFFLSACDTFPVILNSYPSDASELIKNYDYKLYRSKLIFIPKCRSICDHLDEFIKILMIKNK